MKKLYKIMLSLSLALTLLFAATLSVDLPVTAADSEDNVAIFRLYNPNSGEHFYTASQVERDTLILAGWNGEGYAWMAPAYSDQPVYRLYSPSTGDHHYTLSSVERDVCLSAGWADEGSGWYSSEDAEIPIYRQFNPNATGAGSHNYTKDGNEASFLVSLGWNDEAIGWYGVDAEFPEYPAEPVYITNPWDYLSFGYGKGASDVNVSPNKRGVGIFFGGDWHIEIWTNLNPQIQTYGCYAVSIVDSHTYTVTYWAPISLTGEDVALAGEDGLTVKKEAISVANTVIDYMKEHPYPYQEPNIPGLYFRTD